MPRSAQEKKREVEKYLDLQEQIEMLTKKSDEIYASFDEKMIAYLPLASKKRSLEKDLVQNIEKLEAINEKIENKNAQESAFNEKLKDVLGNEGKTKTFVPQNDSISPKTKEKSKLVDDKEKIGPFTKRSKP